jgi:phenylacetate-CoA ligase
VLVTSLHHRTIPLIRDRIDDRTRLAPPSTSYPAYGRIAEIDGRSDDVFRYGDVTVHPHTFRKVISRFDTVRDYQVRQTASGADVLVDVRRPGDDLDVLARDLTTAVTAAGLPDARVTVTSVETIPRSPYRGLATIV